MSLTRILEHTAFGQTARFERYAANMLFWIAAGKHIDPDKTARFADQVDKVFVNPFAKTAPQPKTGAEIIGYIYNKVEEARKWIS